MKFADQMILSSVDYPGQMCYTLFTIGCNLRCEYCHNMELVRGDCDIASNVEILTKLEKQKQNVNCITITGGEPTLQPHLLEFCKLLKTQGFNIKIDTNGLNPHILKQLIDNNVLDYIAMDIKTYHMNYVTPRLLGLENYDRPKLGIHNSLRSDILKRLTSSIKLLKESSVLHEYRTTPTMDICTKDDFVNIARYLSFVYENDNEPMWYIQTTKLPTTVDPSGINLYTEEDLLMIVQHLSNLYYPNTKKRKR